MSGDESEVGVRHDNRAQMKMGGYWDSLVVLMVIGTVLFLMLIGVLFHGI